MIVKNDCLNDYEDEDEEADDDDDDDDHDDDVFFNMLHRFVCFSTTLPTFNSSLHLLFFAALFFMLSFLSSYSSYEHQILKLQKRLRVKIRKSAELHGPFVLKKTHGVNFMMIQGGPHF